MILGDDLLPATVNLTPAAIYAQDKDESVFFFFFFDIFSSGLRPLKCNEIIIGGNFNLVLDRNKDKVGGLNKTHQNSVQVYHEYENALDQVVDIWRALNEKDRRST